VSNVKIHYDNENNYIYSISLPLQPMGIVFRQSIKTTIVTFTGAALGGLVVLLSPKVFPKPELGLITNITLTGAIVQLLVIMGTANLIQVYTQRYKSTDKRRKALLTIAVLTALTGTAIFTTAYFLLKTYIVGLYNPEDQVLINKYYHVVPVLVFLWGLMTIFDQYLVAHVKIAISTFSREVILRICNLTLIGLFFIGVIDFDTYVTGNVLIYSVPLLIIISVAAKTEGFGLTRNLKLFSLADYKDMLHFSWYHLLVGASITILNFIDTLMLGPLDKKGIASAAVYGIATFIASVMYMPYRAMANSSLPILNEAYIEKDTNKVRDLFTRAGINIFISAVGMFVLIGVNLDNAITLLPAGYESVKPIVLVLMIGKLFDMATGMNNELISISKYYKFNFRISLLLLALVFTLDRIYIPQYGTMGAAWVATCSLIVFNTAKMIFLYAKMRLHPFTPKSWLVLVAGAIAAAAGYFWPYIVHPIVDTIIRSGVAMAVYCLALILLKPSNDLVEYLNNIKSSKRLF